MIKKRESIVPETIKKRLESYPGWSDLVRLRKKTQPILSALGGSVHTICSQAGLLVPPMQWRLTV